ncbi:MAG TPA: IPT/TIG domain-containing protein, partial [Solirubrobacteraceae bacterium]|nr:IPT/TIG domain-containing protein [Solirubrobacteraceae bacterium]
AVSGVSPNGGSTAGGAKVTVTGSGFALGTAATSFTFGKARAATVDCTSSTTCEVVAPAHAAGTVDVTAKVGKLKSPSGPSDLFTYG